MRFGGEFPEILRFRVDRCDGKEKSGSHTIKNNIQEGSRERERVQEFKREREVKRERERERERKFKREQTRMSRGAATR